MATIGDIADYVTSKNAGPFLLTIDMVFPDEPTYNTIKEKAFITPELVASRYNCAPEDVMHIVYFDPANAVKVTLKRRLASGSFGDGDMYGAGQHVPLLTCPVPES